MSQNKLCLLDYTNCVHSTVGMSTSVTYMYMYTRLILSKKECIATGYTCTCKSSWCSGTVCTIICINLYHIADIYMCMYVRFPVLDNDWIMLIAHYTKYTEKGPDYLPFIPRFCEVDKQGGWTVINVCCAGTTLVMSAKLFSWFVGKVFVSKVFVYSLFRQNKEPHQAILWSFTFCTHTPQNIIPTPSHSNSSLSQLKPSPFLTRTLPSPSPPKPAPPPLHPSPPHPLPTQAFSTQASPSPHWPTLPTTTQTPNSTPNSNPQPQNPLSNHAMILNAN